MLYIGPVVFISSYASPTIPAEPNMNKDFVISSDWYDESWTYRKNITITGSAGAGTNYQVRIPVTYDSDMQDNFDDIRFTDNETMTLLDSWRESYIANTSAVFWVNVSADLGSNQKICMYFGNSTVSTTSNGTATFLMYEDWTSETIDTDVWDVVTPNGDVFWSAVGASHGTIARFDADAEDSIKITSDYDCASPIAVMFRSNIEITGAGNTARQGSGYDGAFAFNLVQSAIGTQIFYVYDDDGNQDSQAMSNDYFDAWVTFQITRDGTNSKLYADTVLIETASCQPDIITTNPAASIMVSDSEDRLYSDWVAVRKFIAIEPAFDSFGDKEDISGVITQGWEIVGEAKLIFSVPYDETGLNILIVFLGLIMVPASTIYAAKGGLREASMDKVFIVIVVFILGWALFLGGIM